MSALRYRVEHNKVGYLLKPTRSDDYHQIIDFLRASHIRYALTHNPIIFDSLVKQFWSTATLRSPELGPPAIQATIDKTPYTITEELVRCRLQLDNDGGINELPITKIYSRMDNLGTMSGSWDQFGSPLVVSLICLSNGIRFNWSSYIFKGMVTNIGNAKKFLMYPRFLQAILVIELGLQDNTRQQTSDPHAPVLEHGQSSDPNTASFSRSHETAAGPFTNIENEPLGGSFHISPPQSTRAPPAGQPSGGAEDPITLTALSSVVSILVHKVNSLETELKYHKKLFKDVVGKLVKKVKAMEQDVDLDALRALANAAVTVDSNISLGGASNNPVASTNVPTNVSTGTTAIPAGALTILPGASIVPSGNLSVSTDVSPSVAPAGVSNKGKSPMVEEDILVKAKTFKQIQEDILGEQAAKRLHDEEQAQLDRQRAELQRRRQEEVLDSAMYYTEADWLNIMAQVEANASLSKTLLGDDASEDNFPTKMAALIKRKKPALAEKLAKERQNRPMSQAQQRAYMRQFVKNQSSVVYTTGWSPVLEEPSSKRKKYTEAPIPSVPEAPHSPAVSSPPSFGTRKKSLGRKRLTKSKSTLQELDLDADAQTFIKVVSTKDSDDKATTVWSTLGDLQVLFDSHKGGKGSCVWQHQDLWEIRSWRLYTLSNVHFLETVSGEVLYMFADLSYPLSVKLMEKMLTHKSEIDSDVVGNDMTTTEQLIQFIKNQIAVAQVSFVSSWVFNLPMLYLLRVEMVINSPWIMLILGTKELASPEQMAP
nr:synaptobrevin, longin-like domain protein [Tanacetum cinerariifolium]